MTLPPATQGVLSPQEEKEVRAARVSESAEIYEVCWAMQLAKFMSEIELYVMYLHALCRVNNLDKVKSSSKNGLREFRKRQFTQPSVTLGQPITELRYQKIKSIGAAAVDARRRAASI